MIARRRDWTPRLGHRYRRIISILLAATPFVAGADFLMGEHAETLTIVERTLPTEVWGGLLVLAGTLAALGYWLRLPWVCILGLHLSGTLFAALSAGIAWASIDVEGGFRGPWLYLIVSLMSWFAALGYADQVQGKS
jgi:hypothetical protein